MDITPPLTMSIRVELQHKWNSKKRKKRTIQETIAIEH